MSDVSLSEETTEFPAFEIETARLVLRAPEPGDVAAMTALANDCGVATMTGRMPYPYARSDAERFVAEQRSRRANGQEWALAVVDKAEGTFLGCVGLAFHLKEPTAEIGYWLGRPHWGAGLATEAARALIDHGFEASSINAVTGSSRVINEASRRVLEKCGMRYTGSGLSPAPARGGALPVDRFRLSRRDWESFKAWRPALIRPMGEVFLG
jgi:RimJ/RimL family protein N-acetyltransferase